jgi:2-dehydro-3-deoxyglucarate aldolase
MRATLKQQLKSRSFTAGTWVALPNSSIPDILTDAGYGWIVVDNEHSMMSLESIQALISAIQRKGAEALVRVSHNFAAEIRKVLDAGANGIICPMINSKEDAKRFVDAVKYPPMGQRTYGLYRAQGYGADSKEYFASANEKTVAIAQIEHIDGARNIESILNMPGIDGILTGPYDLSGSLGLPGQLEHIQVIQAEKDVIAACRRKSIACGAHLVHPSPETIGKKLDLGYDFLAVGVDFIFLRDSAIRAANDLKEALSHRG